jgi:hypothetical protein
MGSVNAQELQGYVKIKGQPHLYQRKKDGKKCGVDVADLSGAREAAKYRVPGLGVRAEFLKRTYPLDWEVALTADGPQDGLVTLRLFQRYARALCDVHGEPLAKGGHRYDGNAYECFCRADMSVLSADAETRHGGEILRKDPL